MIPITKKLDSYLSLGINDLKEKDFIALFGKEYRDFLIQKGNSLWYVFIFEEEKKMYSVFVKVTKQKFETFRLVKGIHRTRYYEELDCAMIDSLKRKASFYKEELEKITKVLTHKKD